MKGLGYALKEYARDNDEYLPTAEKWCYLLITEADVDTKSFVCYLRDAIEGESSYALNKNVTGMKVSEIPPDVVILFETNFGRIGNLRKFPITSRDVYSFFEGWYDEAFLDKDKRVYELRWNQVGGPEILTTEHHKGKGCNILFADGYAAFIKKEDLDTLRWKP